MKQLILINKNEIAGLFVRTNKKLIPIMLNQHGKYM